MPEKMTPNKILDLFEEKFNRLQKSSLLRFLTRPGWKFSFDFKTNAPNSDSVFPELESIESYVLNLRFFIQDNEPISIRNLSEFYCNYCQDNEAIEKFSELRNILNSELDKSWPFRFNSQNMTFRDIFEGFMYSKFSHSNVENHKVFNNLIEHPLGNYLALDCFLRCINLIHDIITMIYNLNKIAFTDLNTN